MSCHGWFATVIVDHAVAAAHHMRWPRSSISPRPLARQRPATPPAPDVKEAEALISALNKSAERTQTLWISFLVFGLYVAIASSTTTHRILFLQEPLRLPILNLELPLLGFYLVVPFAFLVFHFYMLMQLVLLARTAKAFDDSIMRAFPKASEFGKELEIDERRDRFRMRLENSLFLQLIVGAHLERDGGRANNILLRQIALLTLAVTPTFLLIAVQLRFLPYHDPWVSWWHRLALALDLVLIWTLWRAYRVGWGEIRRPPFAWRTGLNGVLTLIALGFSTFMATYPGEWHHDNAVKRGVDQAGRLLLRALDVKPRRHGGEISSFLFGFEIPVLRVSPDRRGWFPNRLWLPNESLVDAAKLDRVHAESEKVGRGLRAYTISLAGRDLTGAVLPATDLRLANLSDAKLEGAMLRQALLDGVNLARAVLIRAELNYTRLVEADLSEGLLEGARFISAAMPGADFSRADLRGARLGFARLEGANFDGARLEGANLSDSRMDGTSFTGAQLQGAILDMATFRGASMRQTKLQGASLQFAKLNGAVLTLPQLQGATLRGADLTDASLLTPYVYGMDRRELALSDSFVSNPVVEPQLWDNGQIVPFTLERAGRIAAAVRPYEPEISARLDHLFGDLVKLSADTRAAEFWARAQANSRTEAEQAKALKTVLLALSCDNDASPYLARGLIHNGIMSFTGLDVKELRDDLKRAARKDLPDCPGPRRLTERDLRQLDRW
jgi:uncharacterized protein YjbI with pentapeptide repeats